MNKLREEIKKDAQRYSDDPALQKAYEDGANEALQKYPTVFVDSQFVDLSNFQKPEHASLRDCAMFQAKETVMINVIRNMIRDGCCKATEKVQNGVVLVEFKAAGLRLLDDHREGGSHD